MTNSTTPTAPNEHTPAARDARRSVPRPDRPGAVQHQDEQTAAIRTVIAYTRVADRTRQASIQAQRADLDAEIAFHGWTAREWIDDLGQPGTTLERPGLTRALGLLAHHQVDALVVCEATRLARSAAVTRQLAAHAAAYGWQLIIVSDEPQFPLFPTEQPQGT